MTTNEGKSARLGGCFVATLVAALSGCSSDDAVVLPPAPGGPETPGETPTDETPTDGAPTSSAIMLVGQIYGTDAYNTYIGILPEVPEGDVSFARFREFGNANAYSNAGYVFVEEDGVMQRFSVNEDLELVDGPRFTWRDFGLAEINTTSTVFISAERAYTFAPEIDLVLVWNPETMERTGTLPLELPERPAGMETFPYDGYVVGDKVFWNMFSGDWDTITPYPSVTLAIADANSDEEPVRVIEDDRCIPGGPASIDANGDYYVQAGAYYGYFLAYGDVDPSARTCVLRVKAGQTEFDQDYLLDYRELTGSYVSDPWFNISGSQYFARSWDPTVPFPDSSDNFYDNAALRPLVVDIATGDTRPYPDLGGIKTVDGVTRQVDGVTYFQLSETGYVENGNTDVVELRPDGIVPRFHLSGFLLGLERVR